MATGTRSQADIDPSKYMSKGLTQYESLLRTVKLNDTDPEAFKIAYRKACADAKTIIDQLYPGTVISEQLIIIYVVNCCLNDIQRNSFYQPALSRNPAVATSFSTFESELLKFYNTQAQQFHKFLEFNELKWTTQTAATFIGQFEQHMRRFPAIPEVIQCHMLLAKANQAIHTTILSYFDMAGTPMALETLKRQLQIHQEAHRAAVAAAKQPSAYPTNRSRPKNSGQASGSTVPKSSQNGSNTKSDTTDFATTLETQKLKDKKYEPSPDHPNWYPHSFSPYEPNNGTKEQMYKFLEHNKLCTYCRRETCKPDCKKLMNNK